MIDLKKPVRTKEGLKATIIDYKMRGHQPLLVIVHYSKSDEAYTYSKGGHFYLSEKENEMDLENYEPDLQQVS